MEIEILPAGPIQTNSYLILNRNEGKAIVIDAGPDSYKVICDEATKNNVAIEALIITHPHWDHILDVYKFVQDGVPVYASKSAVNMIENTALQESLAFPDTEFHDGQVDHPLSHNEILTIAGYKLEVRDAPGHCPGSIIIYSATAGCCFTGDVIFDGSVGRTDLPGGDMNTLMESILEQIYTLPDETILYPGHGSSTLVGKERISNPFITA